MTLSEVYMLTTTKTTIVDRRGGSSFNYGETDKKYPDWSKLYNESKATLSQTRTDDGPMPGFRYLIRNGMNATTNLTGTKQTLEIVFGRTARGYHLRSSPSKTWQWDFVQGNVCQGSALSPVTVQAISSRVQNEAKVRFIKKCIQAHTAFNGSVFVGEIREAIRAIKSPGQALRRGIDQYFEAARRRRRGNARQRAEAIAGTWLEYSFGWKPLIDDIEDASVALALLARERPKWKPISASADEEISGDDLIDDVGLGNLEVLVRTRSRQKSIVVYRGAVDFGVSSGLAMDARYLGFRWDQFVPTLWELVPYSFLVDYFTNIGDVINSWSFATSNLRWSNVTTVREASQQRDVVSYRWKAADSPLFEYEWIHQPSSSYATTRVVNRSSTAGSLIPSFEFQIIPPGSLKWLNLAALATTHARLVPY